MVLGVILTVENTPWGPFEAGRQAATLESVQASLNRIEEKVAGKGGLEHRVRKLETWRSWSMGIVAALGALFGMDQARH